MTGWRIQQVPISRWAAPMCLLWIRNQIAIWNALGFIPCQAGFFMRAQCVVRWQPGQFRWRAIGRCSARSMCLLDRLSQVHYKLCIWWQGSLFAMINFAGADRSRALCINSARSHDCIAACKLRCTSCYHVASCAGPAKVTITTNLQVKTRSIRAGFFCIDHNYPTKAQTKVNWSSWYYHSIKLCSDSESCLCRILRYLHARDISSPSIRIFLITWFR